MCLETGKHTVKKSPLGPFKELPYAIGLIFLGFCPSGCSGPHIGSQVCLALQAPTVSKLFSFENLQGLGFRRGGGDEAQVIAISLITGKGDGW